MLRIPTEAGSEPPFVSLLLDTGLPLCATRPVHSGNPGVPVAAPNDERADALGEGLRAAGAARRGEVSEATVGNRPGLAAPRALTCILQQTQHRSDPHVPTPPPPLSRPRLAAGAGASQAPVYTAANAWKASTTPIRCIIWTSPPRPAAEHGLPSTSRRRKPSGRTSPAHAGGKISAPGPGSAPSTCSPTTGFTG
ncbi:hypothetical protein ACPA9J_23195 [Pseudomonas aeruginosa]